ncbi:hypothetical protein KAR91_37765 [Candidatus Pacearchaeota archaeon]|nr:hypothetical protein [Candidatus Pacearchaeota archaeon]
MEKRTQYQTTAPAPSYDQFHLRLAADLLEWYRQRAADERRKINAVMGAALEEYREARGIEEND